MMITILIAQIVSGFTGFRLKKDTHLSSQIQN